MSLICWIPLINNTLNNQGLKNMSVTNNSATYSSSGGKLSAGCWSFSDGTKNGHGISIDKNFTDIGSNRSICAWVYPKGNHADYAGAIVSSGNWNSSRWSFGVERANGGFTGFDSGYSNYYSTSIPLNTWTHLCVTVANGVTKFYKNGVYLGEQSRGSGTVSSDASNTMIGRETYAGGYFGFNGSIQDVRIYDHCLTPQEVKEISKGLVAHYTLGSASLTSSGNLINGLAGGGLCTVSGNSINVSGTNSDTYFYIKTTKAMTSGKLYRLSCIGSGFPASALYNFSIAEQPNTGPGLIKIKNGPCMLTFVANDTCANAGTNIIMDDTSRTAGAGTISGLCLEEISSVSDSSGYSRNLTITGNVSPADSPRYKKGLQGNGTLTTSNITINTPFTISMWVQFPITSSTGSGNEVTIGPFNLYKDHDGVDKHTFSVTKSDSTNTYLTLLSPAENRWYHVAITSDGTNVKIYKDGNVGTYSIATKNGLTTFNLMLNNNIKLSDVRLYATELSTDDVKDLYNLGALIS